MTKPNFFIVGAPKCGTTSLFNWLSKHQNIFTSKTKEPNYFCQDLFQQSNMCEDEYLRLFERVEPHHIAIGEASTRYLYSQEAIDNILHFCDKPKFIAVVRNPVDMLHSLYNHLLYLNVEHCRSFKEAWNLREKRARGECIVSGCTDPHSLAYGEIGLLGEQIQRLFNKVPIENRIVLVLEDMAEDPGSIYRKVLQFLNVKDDGYNEFSVSNQSMGCYSWSLNQALSSFVTLKRSLGIAVNLGVLNKIKSLNRRKISRVPLSQQFREELQEYFLEDVLRLAQLINRDLSHWVQRPN